MRNETRRIINYPKQLVGEAVYTIGAKLALSSICFQYVTSAGVGDRDLVIDLIDKGRQRKAMVPIATAIPASKSGFISLAPGMSSTSLSQGAFVVVNVGLPDGFVFENGDTITITDLASISSSDYVVNMVLTGDVID